MKKKLFLLLSLCLSVALTFLFVACGNVGEDDNDVEENGSETGNENGSGNAGSFDYQTATANAQLETMRQGNGYLIKFDIDAMENSEATQIAIGAKGDVHYLRNGGDEYFFDLSSEDSFVYYERNGEDWEKTVTPYTEYYTRAEAMDLMKTSIGLYGGWLTYYDGFVSDLNDATKTSATVAGRACDKYTFSAAALTGVGLNMARATYGCCIDKSTSICLKWEYTMTVDGKTESWTMECKEFNVNPDLTLPTVSEENTRVNDYGDYED